MKFKIVMLFALVAIGKSVDAQNNTGTDSTTSDGDGKTEETALQKGMSPIFDLYRNFLDTVMPQNFYDAKSASFNVQTLINMTNSGDYTVIQSKWQDLVKTFGGYAGCIIAGLLFMVFMPIAGLIYCCCHCCCHRCGGTKEMMDPPHASCKRWTYTILLLIFTTLMLAGGIVTFLGSDLLHKSLRNEDNNGLLGKMDQSLGHLQSFTNQTINDIVHEARDKIIDKGLSNITTTIKNAAERTVARVKASINASQLLNDAQELGDTATDVLDGLKVLKEQVTNLQDLEKNVTEKLKVVKDNLANAPADIKSKMDGIKLAANYSALENQTNKIKDIESAVNIKPAVEKAEKEFDNVTKNIDAQVKKEINETETHVNNMNKTINDQVGKINEKTKPFMDNVNKGIEFSSERNEDFKLIADIIWYVCIGMGCAVILIVFFYYMGVLFGLCGERPGPRAACCNRETGAHLLCGGICCSFLFAWFLIQFVITLFIVGGFSYSLACKYVDSGIENVDTFENVLSEGFSWNISSTFGVQNLTIAGMFKNCKKNEAVYSALNLQYIFDIDKEFNISDVEDEVKKMKDKTTFTLPNIKLLSDDLKNELNSYKDAAVSQINFTPYTVELNKPLFGNLSLDEVIKELNETSQNTGSQTLKTAAEDLAKLRDNEIQEIKKSTANLSSTVITLENKTRDELTKNIDNLIANIKKSEVTFNNNSSNIVKEELGKVVDDILKVINHTVNDTKYAIKHNVGKCRDIYDAAQSVVDAVCIVTLDPLNSIWFGLGWSIFFFIPCIIFAALLSNLYKRTEKFRKKDQGFDDPIRSQYPHSYDGYRGNRYEDNVPLTSMGKDHRTHGNGAYNHGYEGREYEHEPRYHRDEPSGYPPDNYPRDRGVHRGSAGHHYAQPHADPYDQPPHYEDAVSERYERVSSHGGYPRLTNY